MRQAIRAAPTLATAVSTVAALAVGPPGAAAPAAAATTAYTITGLGPPGGSNPCAINATGEVTGYWYLATLMPAPSCPPVYGNTNKPAGNTPGKPSCITSQIAGSEDNEMVVRDGLPGGHKQPGMNPNLSVAASPAGTPTSSPATSPSTSPPATKPSRSSAAAGPINC